MTDGYDIQVGMDFQAGRVTWALHKWTRDLTEAMTYANKLVAQGWSVRVLGAQAEVKILHLRPGHEAS